jgi:hypothetical protein
MSYEKFQKLGNSSLSILGEVFSSSPIQPQVLQYPHSLPQSTHSTLSSPEGRQMMMNNALKPMQRLQTDEI